MEAQIKLGRIFGVRVGLHYSWLIIALLVTLSLVGQFYAINQQWGTALIWATATITSLLFFTTLVLHELSHAAVARSRGLAVRSITLFALGGVAQRGRGRVRVLTPADVPNGQSVQSLDPPFDANIPGRTFLCWPSPSIIHCEAAQTIRVVQNVSADAVRVRELGSRIWPDAAVFGKNSGPHF